MRIPYEVRDKKDLQVEEWIRKNIPHQKWSQFRRDAVREKVEQIKLRKKAGLV